MRKLGRGQTQNWYWRYECQRYSILLTVILLLSVGQGVCSTGNGLDPRLLHGVYAGQSLSGVEKVAVEHLQSGMRLLYGIELPLLNTFPEIVHEAPVVILGADAANEAGRTSDEEIRAVSPGGHIIRSDAQGIVIAGRNDWDTRFGVYHFLELLGVRFFLPGFKQAKYPAKPPVLLPELSLSDKPDFAYRPGRSDVWRQMYYQLGDPHNGLDSQLFTKETGSDLWIDHTAGYLVPKLLYYAKHPEYYAMQADGRRIDQDRFTDHRTPLCLSNAEVARVSTERALGWIEQEPDTPFFMITYGDTGLWCQCAECRKLDPGEGEYSDRLLAWVNPIAKAVGGKYSDRILMTFAYGGTDNPPLKHTPEKNVWMVGSTGLGNFPFWDHAWRRKSIPEKQLEKIDGWLRIVPDRFAVCEYQSGTYKPALIDSMVARLRYYKEKGVRGIVFTYGVPRNFKTLWQYLLGRLMWDVDQDAMKLAREFVDFYYGAAAGNIWKIFELSHKRYLDTLHDTSALEGGYPAGFYSREFTDQVLDNFMHAQMALQGDKKLLDEVRAEELYFIEDWLRHPAYEQVDDAARKILETQLAGLLRASGQSEKDRNELARKVHKLALEVEASRPGTVGVIEEWIAEERLFSSPFVRIANGVQLTPQSFLYAGFGPANYGYNCPPKDAVGVYVQGNSKRRSHKMTAGFELDLQGDKQAATLTIEGQAAPIAGVNPQISIRLNGKEIFKGAADYVKHNWSLQRYPIPAGYIQAGKNALELINISDPSSIERWNQGWFLVSDAVIRFE